VKDKKPQRDRDLRDVMREEQTRGRRPLDTDEVRRQKERRKHLADLVENRDLSGLVSALRESGRTKAQIAEVVKLWRQLLP
jgi:hypothetical protein